MKVLFLVISALIMPFISIAQRWHVGLFGGLAAYNGDLTDKVFPKKVTNGAAGITVNYELQDNIMLRGGITYAIVGGADRYSSKPDLVARNLSFETKLLEFSVLGEYYFMNLYENKYSPYAFAGLAVFRYNPYAYTPAGDKVFLKPLATEGQGLPQYPDRKPYKLTEFGIPFGGGIKFAINDNLRIGVEMGLRKLFTDYLDDVSRTYADPADLLAGNGQLSVDMSYRGDELAGGDPTYPSKTTMRGNEENPDWYYFTGLHVTMRLGGEKSGGLFGGKKKNGLGCPTNVY